MTLSPVAHIKTWNSARRVAKLLQSTQRQYIGCECYEVVPNGTEYRAVIVKMEWENSYGLEGNWAVRIRYFDTGMETWTDCSVLRLTGEKFSNIDEAVKPNQIYIRENTNV